jgi:two-component system sensor histidine kinase/response regulator
MQSRILVVDDNPKNIQVLATHLTNEDYEVEYASNGKEAVHMIEKEDFDLILLDVMMPGIDGFETCRRIKKIESKKHIPIIFVTAKTDIDSLTLGFEYGGVDYISKPFKSDELLLRVSTHIELKKTRDLLNYHKTFLEKKESYYNDKINTQHREFLFKVKDLENTITMQSKLIELYSTSLSNSINSLSTPLSLLKLEEHGEKVDKLLVDLENSINQSDKAISFLRKNDKYFINRASAIKLEKVNLEKLIGDSLTKMSKAIKQKKLDFAIDIDGGKEINADKLLMSEIVESIIKNSVDYCPEQASIKIKILEEESRTILQISDSGPGFEKKLLLYPFLPVEKSKEEPGLSLFFAKYICDLHNFIIKIGNNPDQGAFVKITF